MSFETQTMVYVSWGNKKENFFGEKLICSHAYGGLTHIHLPTNNYIYKHSFMNTPYQQFVDLCIRLCACWCMCAFVNKFSNKCNNLVAKEYVCIVYVWWVCLYKSNKMNAIIFLIWNCNRMTIMMMMFIIMMAR